MEQSDGDESHGGVRACAYVFMRVCLFIYLFSFSGVVAACPGSCSR